MKLADLPRFDRALGAFSLAAIALVAITFPPRALLIPPAQVLQLAGVLAILAAVVFVYLRRGAVRLASLVRMLFWALLLNTLCSLLFYLPVRSGAPLADPSFARLDASLGFATSSVVAWSRARPVVDALLFRVYDSLPIACIASVALPPLLGRPARTQIMLLGVLVAVVVSVALSFRWSGVGPWEGAGLGGGFTPTGSEAQCAVTVHALKAGVPYTIDLHYCDPIITIPSWHTIFALLSAFVWRPIRFAFPLALVWSGLIVLSTITTGWHYLIDVIAGSVIAFAAQLLAERWLMPRLAGGERPFALPSDNSGTGGP